MRVPLSWLREYVSWDVTLDELTQRLTFGGLEVDAIEQIGETWDETKVFVGQVVQVRPHPDADRLVLVTVEYGAAEPLEVVTGAPNLHVGDSGQKVVLAVAGARLIDPYADSLQYKTLKRSKIRGVASEGMVCSEKELGISDEHTGIVILPADAPVGTPLVKYWGDTVLDLGLTPNLARCNAVIGVAREVAALTGGPLHLGDPQVEATGPSIVGQVEIEIADPDLCPRYVAALIKNVRIGPSPRWMQQRLQMAGMRPISNVVDITNYVMLEMGQPLHAFDYRLLRARTPGGPPTIIVRRATPGEKMRTLDDVERTFGDDMLLITDGGGPVGVAGIMGGQESEVTDDTVDVLLEAANFDYINVRSTSEALRIPSEAAQRFGRGVDPELAPVALRRAAELMRLLADGEVAAGFVDLYPRPPAPLAIDFQVSEVRRLLGIEMAADEVAAMLTPLGFGCTALPAEGTGVVRVEVPSFRLDVSIPADLVEEVARIYGYDRLPMTLMSDELPAQERNFDLELEEHTRDVLVGCGLTEIISYSMTNMESVAALQLNGPAPDPADYVRIANPLSRDHEYMRQTLMNTTLETVARNWRFTERVAVFEIAAVYLPVAGQLLPDQPRRLSLALTGPREPRSWLTDGAPGMDFYDLKGVVETLCHHLNISNVDYAPVERAPFHPGRAAALLVGGQEIGVFGELHPTVRGRFDLPEQRVCLAEIDLEQLLTLAQQEPQFQPISRMPALKMDLALVVDNDAAADALEAAIRRAGGDLLVDVVLFDVYRGAQVGAGKKSLAYSLTFQAMDRTLTNEQAAKQRDRIVAALEREYGAQIRG